jgi:mannitol/fructose-specific phosphotransferase system IIA component
MNVLEERNVILGAKLADKSEAVKLAGEVLIKNGYVKPEYLDDMFQREELVSTYIGNNVAIPHGLHTSGENILHSGISFIQVPDGVEFGDEEESNIAYLVIGIAGKDGSHLDILGKIAEILTDMDQIERLRCITESREVLETFGAALD